MEDFWRNKNMELEEQVSDERRRHEETAVALDGSQAELSRAAGEVHALFISAANVAAMRGGGGASSLQVNEAARRAAIVLWELSVKALLNRSSGAPGAGALAAGTVSTPPHKGGGTSNSKSGL